MPITPGGNYVYNFGNSPAMSSGLIDNIPTSGQEGQVYFSTDSLNIYIYTSGSWQLLSGGGGGGSQTWQQTLTVLNGSVLTRDNTIAVNGYEFIFDNVSNFGINIVGTYSISDFNTGANLLLIDPSGDFRINNNNAGNGFNTMHWNPDGSTLQYVNDGYTQYVISEMDNAGTTINRVLNNNYFVANDWDNFGNFEIVGNDGNLQFQTLFLQSNGSFTINGNDGVALAATMNVDYTGNTNFYGWTRSGSTVQQFQLANFNPFSGNALYSVDPATGILLGSIEQNLYGGQINFNIANAAGNGPAQALVIYPTDSNSNISLISGLSTQLLVSDTLANFPDNSAVLQADSTNRGFLPPRLTTAQKLSITNIAIGLMVFDTTLKKISYYDGSTWINL
jgi:hypothetical protein